MKTVYLYGSRKVKGFLGEAPDFSTAKALAKKKFPQSEEGVFILPANVTFDDADTGGGGYDAFLIQEAKGKGKARAFTIPWQKVPEGMGFWEVSGKDATMPWHADLRKRVVKALVRATLVEEAWESQGTTGILLMSERPKGAPYGYMFKKNVGMEWCQGGKIVKRGTQAWSRWYLGFLSDDQLTTNCFQVLKGVEIEKRYDGAIGLPVVYKEIMLETMKVSQETKEKLKKVNVWNGRIFLPGGILPEAPHGALIKGQFYFSEHLEKITFHECNIKKEVRIEEGQPVRMGMTPQEGKLKERDTDQFYACAPWLFTKEDRKARITKVFEGYKKDFLEGKVEVDLIDLEEKVAAGRLEDGSQYVQAQRLLGLALSAGVPKEWIPKGIWKDFLLGKGMKMVDLEKAKLRVPLPYATHCQVVSHSLMEMIKPGYLENCGLKERIPSGFMAFDEEYKLFVVGDEDYEKVVQVTHGGSDLDDFYAQVFRKEGGLVKVFLFRSPCGWGEWSSWTFQGPLPKKGWSYEDVPVVEETGIARSTPRHAAGKVENGLLPGTKADWTKRYDYEEFCKKLDASGEGAGGIVNLIGFFDLHRRYSEDKTEIKYDESLLFSMEQVIDTVTQCDNEENIPILDAFVTWLKKRLSEYIVKGGECERAFVRGKKIDKALFTKDDDVKLNLVKGDFSEVFEHAEKERRGYEEWVEKTIEGMFRIPEAVMKGCTKEKLQKKAMCLEKVWRGCWGGGEKRSTRNGNRATNAGLTTISQEITTRIKKFDVKIEELVPYLVRWVYADPNRDGLQWKKDKILQHPLVFQAWVDWCVRHLGDLKEEMAQGMIQDREWDCLEEEAYDDFPPPPPKEMPYLPEGTSVVIEYEECILETDLPVEILGWNKTRTMLKCRHESLGLVLVDYKEVHRVTAYKGERALPRS